MRGMRLLKSTVFILFVVISIAKAEDDLNADVSTDFANGNNRNPMGDDVNRGSGAKRGFSSWAGKRTSEGVMPQQEEAMMNRKDRFSRMFQLQTRNPRHRRHKRSLHDDDDVTALMATLLRNADVNNYEDGVMRRLLNDVSKRYDAGSTGERRGFSPWAGKRSSTSTDATLDDADFRRCVEILRRIAANSDAVTSRDEGDSDALRLTQEEVARALQLVVALQQAKEKDLLSPQAHLLRERKASFGPWNG